MKNYADFYSFSVDELTSTILCDEFALSHDMKELFEQMKLCISYIEKYEELYNVFDSDLAEIFSCISVYLTSKTAELKEANRHYKTAIRSRRLQVEAQELNRFSDDQNA